MMHNAPSPRLLPPLSLRMRWRRAGMAALLALPLAVASCAYPSSPPPVPPLQAEVIPKPPVSAIPLMWQPGHWNWNGAGYDWAPGEYVPAAGHGNLWMPGYWAAGPGGAGAPLVWQPAHWE